MKCGERKLFEKSFPFPTPLSFKNFKREFNKNNIVRSTLVLHWSSALCFLYFFVQFFEKGVRGRNLSFKKVSPPHSIIIYIS